MDLTASPLTIELPRPFIAACVVSLAVHAGVAGWYALHEDTTTPMQLPRPTLQVKIRALHERVSIASAPKPVRSVSLPTPPRRKIQRVTTPSPEPDRARQTDTVQKPEPTLNTVDRPPPVQVAQVVPRDQPAYSPPSSDSTSLNNPKPDYPPIALRRGIEGLVLLHVDVDEQGHPLDVQVKQSAGFKPLDIAALKAVRRWQFLPARRNGTAVRASVEVPIHFRLI